MPLSKENTRTFHRRLFAGMLQTIEYNRRGDDQAQGTIRKVKLFECRISSIHKGGEPLIGDAAVGHQATWHIPRVEFDRVGIRYVNAGDFIHEIDPRLGKGRTWVILATGQIDIKLFENHVDLHCEILKSETGGS